MLIISRKENETITIEPVGGRDADLTLRRAFVDGPITIRLLRVCGGKARIAIEAPSHLRIWRGGPDAPPSPARTDAPAAEDSGPDGQSESSPVGLDR